jgi:hypothetical protein
MFKYGVNIQNIKDKMRGDGYDPDDIDVLILRVFLKLHRTISILV